MSSSSEEEIEAEFVRGLSQSAVEALDGSGRFVKSYPRLKSFRLDGSICSIGWLIQGSAQYYVFARVQASNILFCKCSCPDGVRRSQRWESEKSLCKHSRVCLLSVVDHNPSSSVAQAKEAPEPSLGKRKFSEVEELYSVKTGVADKGSVEGRVRIVEVPFFLTHNHADSAENKFGLSLETAFAGDYTRGLVTNYMIDLEWMFVSAPHLLTIPLVLVHGMRGNSFDEMLAACRIDLPVNLQVHKPPLPLAWGTHHTKMAVLLSNIGVRVIMTTANYIRGDWATKAQGIWLQDFPLKSNRCPPSSDFEVALTDYVRALKGPAVSIAESLELYDFSRARGILVPSVPGEHGATSWKKYGHMRVRAALEDSFVDDNQRFTKSPLYAQYSSMGSLHAKYIKEQLVPSFAASHRSPQLNYPVRFKAFWPPVDFVAKTYEGYKAGHSIPCSQKNLKPFLISDGFLHVYEGCRGYERASPHIKTYTRSNKEGVLPWVMMTSANLSKAAWGQLQRSQRYGKALVIRSYELGVLVLPHHMRSKNDFSLTPQDPQIGICEARNRQKECSGFVPIETASTHANDGSLATAPLPYRLTAQMYKDSPNKEPWVWDKEYKTPDVHGACYP